MQARVDLLQPISLTSGSDHVEWSQEYIPVAHTGIAHLRRVPGSAPWNSGAVSSHLRNQKRDFPVSCLHGRDNRSGQDAINEQSSTRSDRCSKHPCVLRDGRISRDRLPGNRVLARSTSPTTIRHRPASSFTPTIGRAAPALRSGSMRAEAIGTVAAGPNGSELKLPIIYERPPRWWPLFYFASCGRSRSRSRKRERTTAPAGCAGGDGRCRAAWRRAARWQAAPARCCD